MESLARAVQRIGQTAVDHGLPPNAVGHRWVRHQTVSEYQRRCSDALPVRMETLHPPAIAANPLPRNVESRDSLPKDRGWWGYSFWDVPERTSASTFLATIPDCRLFFYRDETADFYVGLLGSDDRSIELPQITFRPGHGRALRTAKSVARMKKATWVLERVYHNYSHWLTAHLPKICLLKARGETEGMVLPREPDEAIVDSLRMLGLDANKFPTFDSTRPLAVDELTVLGTDRFRPELLQPVRQALGIFSNTPTRRVFISRSRATRRRLLNEAALWPTLQRAGFERVWMEELSFADQVRLMGETRILLAPHGAGLTNMIFCPPGTQIAEIADLSFPNPNFYALSCAMGHDYWLLPARAVGDAHPLEKDLEADPQSLARFLSAAT